MGVSDRSGAQPCCHDVYPRTLIPLRPGAPHFTHHLIVYHFASTATARSDLPRGCVHTHAAQQPTHPQPAMTRTAPNATHVVAGGSQLVAARVPTNGLQPATVRAEAKGQQAQGGDQAYGAHQGGASAPHHHGARPQHESARPTLPLYTHLTLPYSCRDFSVDDAGFRKRSVVWFTRSIRPSATQQHSRVQKGGMQCVRHGTRPPPPLETPSLPTRCSRACGVQRRDGVSRLQLSDCRGGGSMMMGTRLTSSHYTIEASVCCRCDDAISSPLVH
jgi:hypothetical protein